LSEIYVFSSTAIESIILKAIPSKAGFYSRSAKGSHTKWVLPQFPIVYITLSGKDGNDAKRYQIEDVQEALRKVGKEYEP
jgi:predicted RNA binding protein YcfA (HicA-like mRNA interferase family)